MGVEGRAITRTSSRVPPDCHTRPPSTFTIPLVAARRRLRSRSKEASRWRSTTAVWPCWESLAFSVPKSFLAPYPPLPTLCNPTLVRSWPRSPPTTLACLLATKDSIQSCIHIPPHHTYPAHGTKTYPHPQKQLSCTHETYPIYTTLIIHATGKIERESHYFYYLCLQPKQHSKAYYSTS